MFGRMTAFSISVFIEIEKALFWLVDYLVITSTDFIDCLLENINMHSKSWKTEEHEDVCPTRYDESPKR